MYKQITSLQHPLIKHLVKLQSNRFYRSEQKSLVIEGIKVVRELCQRSPSLIKTLFLLTSELIPIQLPPSQITLVSEPVLRKISTLQEPEGIVAELSLPAPQSLDQLHPILALDRVSDPGNLGTLLRTALALGAKGVFLLDGCCDPFNDKAIRAARGATFYLPYRQGTIKELETFIKKNDLIPYIGDLSGIPLNQVTPFLKSLLILGNEAKGISPEVEKLAQKVTIPLVGEVESLNVAVAGGILMQRLFN